MDFCSNSPFEKWLNNFKITFSNLNTCVFCFAFFVIIISSSSSSLFDKEKDPNLYCKTMSLKIEFQNTTQPRKNPTPHYNYFLYS